MRRTRFWKRWHTGMAFRSGAVGMRRRIWSRILEGVSDRGAERGARGADFVWEVE